MRGELQLPHVLLDPPLVLEMRNAGLAMRGCDRRVHVVLDSAVARHLGQALPLRFLAFHARLPGVLDGEHAPRAGERLGQ